MFVLDAFGRRIYRNPGLRFIDPPEGGNEDQGPDLGFPKDTALEQMTVEQREAYWRHYARRHEATVKSRGDYDQLKADSEELARIRAEGQTDQEKALEEARRDGENLGAQRYLRDAVIARFIGLTGKTDEEAATAFAHVDVATFTGQDGSINTDALAAFAGTFGTKQTTPIPPSNPVMEALERQRQQQAGGGSGSIREMQRQRREALTAKK
ncbi:hypothetical protein ASF48_04975 [Rathayibacter sp. Leaf299]|uniref:hypothetical protein n=1 Tax=unclassified Rathayibacter TaxID=2609250 RepID=UPI0006F68483|nr:MULTISPECIES: hypothetical protein [unclassified Rathayibacter]KQQ22539.1 hypothetical protein ASF48_04975 [Rathayibacter sp. Leaf299]